MPFLDADAIDYGRNGYQDVGGALDELFENRTWDGEVDYFTELPSAVANDGKTYYVKKYTLLSPVRLTGLYYSTGGQWKRRSDKVTYTLTSFTGTNKLVKTADTKGQIIETPIEIDANDDLDLKDNNIQNVGKIAFDISIALPTLAEGELGWSDTEGTLNLGMKGGTVNQQIGLELFLRAKAVGSAISNGEIVYISGASGSNPEMRLARADLKATSDCTIAIATEDILENALGYYTTFGKVREIDTSSFPAGSIVYLSDSVAGGMTLTQPSAPSKVVEVGIVLNQNVNEGVINVNIRHCDICLDREITKEPTGFTTPEDLVLTADPTARTITLSGTVEGYWQGLHVPALVDGYESPAHTNDTNSYVLIYDGSSIQWITLANYSFSDLLIAFTFYASGTNERVYARECHGIMQWQVHESEHDTIGTYRDSGGDLADYVLSSTTATDRRPSISATIIKDEDLRTTNSSLASDSNYTHFNLTSTGLANFDTTPVDIVPLSGDRPYWNEFTGGTWQQTLIDNNYYMSIWVLATPPTADSQSQAYRYLFIQGQTQNLTLTAERGLTTSDINLGNLTDLNPEVVFFKRIIIRYQGGNWTFIEVEDITGTKANQTSSPQGNYLSTVSVDTTLTGDGTTSNPLGIDLTNANTWTGKQTFADVDITNILKVDTVSEYTGGAGVSIEGSNFKDNALLVGHLNDGHAQINMYRLNNSSYESAIRLLTNNAPKWLVGLDDIGTEDFKFYSYATTGYPLTLRQSDGAIFMPNVYSDTVSSTPKILSINSDGQLGESTNATPTFATTNIGDTQGIIREQLRIAYDGADTSILHLGTYTENDDYPRFGIISHNVDNTHLYFDGYYDGGFRSSDAGSNFMIRKYLDELSFQYDSGVAQGSIVSYNVGLKLDTSGLITIPGSLNLTNTINEFSTDGTLAGDSDSAVPTEKAVKTYVDGLIGGSVPTSTAQYSTLVANASGGWVENTSLKINGDTIIGGDELTLQANVKVEFDFGSGAVGKIDSNGILYIDEINEYTSANGVEIDGVVLKDSTITTDNGDVIIDSSSSNDSANLRLINDGIHWNLDNFSENLRFFTETGIGTGGAVKMTLLSAGTGRLGIGTTPSTYAKLQTEDTSSLHTAWVIGNNDIKAGIELETQTATATGEAIMNIGVNTGRGIPETSATAAWFRIDTRASTLAYHWYYEASGSSTETALMTLNMSTGKLFVPAVYNNGSSAGRDCYIRNTLGEFSYFTSTLKSKININPIENWQRIYELEPIQYNARKKISDIRELKKGEEDEYTDEYFEETRVSWVAEDAHSLIPETTHDYKDPISDEEGNIIDYEIAGLDRQSITPFLHCAVKEHKNEIDNLKNIIKDLTTRLEALEG